MDDRRVVLQVVQPAHQVLDALPRHRAVVGRGLSGGVGKLAGTVLAALGIGILSYIVGSGSLLLVWPAMPEGLNALITFFATTSMAKVLVFALIVVFLQFRPAGLFPQKGRMVEA